MVIKIGKYIAFCLYRRSYLIWSFVIAWDVSILHGMMALSWAYLGICWTVLRLCESVVVYGTVMVSYEYHETVVAISDDVALKAFRLLWDCHMALCGCS